MARPSTYTKAVALEICGRLVEGESLRSICRSEDMPPAGTVFRWLDAHESFREQYARAREMQADLFADELLDISDDGRNDWMERNHGDEDPGWVINGEHIQRSRLRVDTRKWIASKILAKKYGDRVAVDANLSGAVGQYAAQAIPVEQRHSDALASTAGPATNGHSA